MNMEKLIVSGADMTLVTKCLDFCQALTSQGIPFNFTRNCEEKGKSLFPKEEYKKKIGVFEKEI